MDSERFERAITLRDAGREEDALREFEALADLASDTQEKGSLIANQATCFWRLGRLKEARQRLSEAAGLWTNLYTEFVDACLSVAEGKNDDALRKLTLFLENHADIKQSSDQDIYVDAQDELGRLLFDLGRYADAVSPLEGALSLAEGDLRKKLCFYLGACHYKNEHWQAAEEKLIESLPVDHADPWWAQAQYYRGVCHYKTGKLEAAEWELIQSLPENHHDPLWLHAHYQLGCLYFKRGEYSRAKKAFELCKTVVDDTDTEMRSNISAWLVAIPLK